MIKKLTKKQKKTIQNLKQKIIDTNNSGIKKASHNILIKKLKAYHKISKKVYKNNISIDYKIDNAKISARDTIIFSIQSALLCYAGKKGYCKFYKNKQCYALKNELQYNSSVLYKERQRKQWQNKKAFQLALNFIRIKKLYPSIKYLRLNESGEIQQNDMLKLNKIADILKKYGIKIYTYTHNIEIKKDDITSDNLTINSSNKNIKLSNRFLSFDKLKNKRIMKLKKTNKIMKCKVDCSTCKICTVSKDNIILCDIH